MALGDLLLDRHEVEASILRGGMAGVILARDRLLDRHTAIEDFGTGTVDPAATALFGCAVLASTQPTASIVTGPAVLGVRAVVGLIRTLRSRGTGVG